jgi:hypothetical protein
MKSSNITKFFFFLFLATGLILAGCQKDDETPSTNDSATLQQLSQDDNNVEAANDEAINDVNKMLSGGGHFKSTEALPCNATIDSTAVVNDTITYFITYDGPSCNGKFLRTGKVEVKKKVGTHWRDAGATVIVTFIDLHITRVSNNKSVTLNGTKTHQNVTGGALWELGNGITSIVHKTWGSLTVVFDDNTTRNWNDARQRTYTGSAGQLVMTVDGFGTSGSYTNLVAWGTNRNNEAFYTQISQLVVFKETCTWFPCSGVKIHQIPSAEKKATITFGYNSNNEPIQGKECPTKYRLDWEKGSQSGTVYLWL